jgi:opacity protein-like surface antigen
MKNLRTTLTAIAATGAFAGSAFAGSVAEPVVEAPVIAPVPVITDTSGNWGGFYVGGQLGYADVTGENALNGLDGSGEMYGLHAGYNWDLGNWVLGGEVDYDEFGVDLEDAAGAAVASVDSVIRLKARVGYDTGNWLWYGTAGWADLDTSVGSADGYFYGVGASYALNTNWILGAELLRHDFSDIGGTAGADAEADTLTLRASYRF